MMMSSKFSLLKDYGLLASTLIVGAFGFALLSATDVSAQVRTDIVDGEGFEMPAYSTTFAPPGLPVGSLEGQFALLPNDGSTRWRAATGTEASAVVQNSLVFSGTQAVQVDREVGDAPSFWGVPVDAWPDQARNISIEWDMYVAAAVLPTGADFGPYFGIDAIDDAGLGGTDEGLLGSMGVVATSDTTGEVVYTDDMVGLKPAGATVNLDEWNHFHLDLDFQTHMSTLFLNSVELTSVPFVGSAALGDGSLLNDFSDAPISTFTFVDDVAGTAYFDNYEVYQVSDKTIPEPTTLVLSFLALVSVSGQARRRR